MLATLIFAFAVAVVLLTSLFKVVSWNAATKNVIAVILSVGAAALVIYIQANGHFVATDMAKYATEIYGAAQGFYHFIFTQTPLEPALQKVGFKRKRVESSK